MEILVAYSLDRYWYVGVSRRDSAFTATCIDCFPLKNILDYISKYIYNIIKHIKILLYNKLTGQLEAEELFPKGTTLVFFHMGRSKNHQDFEGEGEMSKKKIIFVLGSCSISYRYNPLAGCADKKKDVERQSESTASLQKAAGAKSPGKALAFHTPLNRAGEEI